MFIKNMMDSAVATPYFVTHNNVL